MGNCRVLNASNDKSNALFNGFSGMSLLFLQDRELHQNIRTPKGWLWMMILSRILSTIGTLALQRFIHPY